MTYMQYDTTLECDFKFHVPPSERAKFIIRAMAPDLYRISLS